MYLGRELKNWASKEKFFIYPLKFIFLSPHSGNKSLGFVIALCANKHLLGEGRGNIFKIG